MKNKPFMVSLLIIIVAAIVISAGLLTSRNASSTKTIGIIMPIEHTALREIIHGFKETMKAEYPHPVRFLIENAQGDANIQRAILQKFINQKIDVIVPIGTAATQMALSMTKTQPIVSVASLYTETERQKREPRNITGIHDEIPAADQMAFLRGIFPNLKKMTLVHSQEEKVFADVAEISRLAKANGITLQELSIHTLPDLYSISKTIDADSQLIFVLKDHTIVSGIRTLAQRADALKIPLITSDEGSVREGAATALGVRETTIGSEGAKLTIKVLNGEPIANMPMQDMSRLVIFFNTAAATKQNLSMKQVADYSQQKNYPIVEINSQQVKN